MTGSGNIKRGCLNCKTGGTVRGKKGGTGQNRKNRMVDGGPQGLVGQQERGNTRQGESFPPGGHKEKPVKGAGEQVKRP